MGKQKKKYYVEGDDVKTIHGDFKVKEVMDVYSPYTFEKEQAVIVETKDGMRKLRNSDIIDEAVFREIDECPSLLTEDGHKRFVALDFETMDTWRATVCSVGCVVFEDGQPTQEFYSLICPPSCYENEHCTEAHGLTYEDVKDSPTYEEVWPQIHEMIAGSPIVAHNKGFEKSCIEACADEFGTESEYEYIDTLRLSRHMLPNLRKYPLDRVCNVFGVRLKNHHNALDDARACGEIFVKMLEQMERYNG